MTEGEDVTQQTEPKEVAGRLKAVEDRLTEIHDAAISDKNDEVKFPKSLRGKLEAVQKEVADIKGIVEGWQGLINKGQSTFWIAIIVGIAGFVIAKLTGGG